MSEDGDIQGKDCEVLIPICGERLSYVDPLTGEDEERMSCCFLPKEHSGPHQAHTNGKMIATWRDGVIVWLPVNL